MKKEKNSLDIKITKQVPGNIDELLQQVFWKDRELAPIAREFLDHIREWGRTDSPYTVAEWENYCTRGGISQSRYHNMLRRLKNAGMIEKVYNKGRGVHEIRLIDRFSETLSRMAEIWDNYTRL